MRILIQQAPVAAVLISLVFLFGVMRPAAATTQHDSHQTNVSVPQRGMTMIQVEQRYGTPQARHASIGQPPITRWDYDGFVAYFEHQRLLHAFAPRPRKH